MTSPGRVPIFDGHNDVLFRLFRRGGTDAPRAFLKGEGKGQLDFPMARQGGFAGGLFAIFVPSAHGAIDPNGEAPSQNISSATALPPALELMPAQRAVFAMVSLFSASRGSRRVAFASAATSMISNRRWRTACWHLLCISKALKQSTRISKSWTWLSDERSRTHACIPEKKFAAVS